MHEELVSVRDNRQLRVAYHGLKAMAKRWANPRIHKYLREKQNDVQSCWNSSFSTQWLLIMKTKNIGQWINLIECKHFNSCKHMPITCEYVVLAPRLSTASSIPLSRAWNKFLIPVWSKTHSQLGDVSGLFLIVDLSYRIVVTDGRHSLSGWNFRGGSLLESKH